MMRILYLARHGSGGNDDEGAIQFALEQLGHTVIAVSEDCTSLNGIPANMLLCHHYHELARLAKVRIPKVSWCFDLIDWPEPKARRELTSD